MITCIGQSQIFQKPFDLHLGHRLYSHTSKRNNLSKSLQQEKNVLNCLQKTGALDYSIIHCFDGDDEQSNPDHPRTTRDYYRAVYCEAFDSLIESIKEKFDQHCFEDYGT